MTPSQLLTRIEQLGTVDAKVLEKIRKQIEDPGKDVRPKGIVKYLLKKEQITKQQANDLLQPTEDEMEVVQPKAKDFDTGTLIAEDILPEVEKPPVSTVSDATIMDEGQYQGLQEDVDVVDVQPIEEPQVLDPMMAADPFQGHGDPALPSGAYGTQSGGYPTASGAYATASGPHSVLPTFKGKRDQKNQFQTKWIYIAFGLLGTILLGVGLLSIVVYGQQPEEMFKAAMNSYDRQSWGDAVKKFDQFIEAFPSHKDIPTAEARRVHAILRGTYSARNYTELIQQADTMLPPLAEDENSKIDLIREDLGVILPRALLDITDKASKSMTSDGTDLNIGAMEAELAKINEYKAVIDNPVYIPNSVKKIASNANNLLKIDNNIRTIVGQIEKEKQYVAALEEITTLRDNSKTDEAFNVYRKLTRNFGDLAARKPLRDLMLTISEKESELVQPVQPELAPVAQSRPSVVAATAVLAVKNGEPVKALEGEVVAFLADGAVYGIDAGSGTIAWRHFVGYQTIIDPVAIDEDRILVADQRSHDLLCLQKQTGELIWRLEVGESFEPPAATLEVVLVSTESGKVLELETSTGQLRHAAQLPQAAGVTALIGERDPYIYQVGEYSNLYVIATQDYTCKEVYSLGHYPGAVAVPPVMWSGYLLVAVNGGDYCDLHVLRPENNGLELRRVQLLSRITDAPVTSAFVKAGRSLLMLADNGQVQMLEIDPTNVQSPVQSQSKASFGEEGGPRPYLTASGTNIWLTGDGIMHGRIRRNQGTIERDVATEARDQFLSPAYKLDEYVLHVRRRAGSGMLSASLADGETLKPIWRTDFAGRMAGPPMRLGDQVVAVTSQGDRFAIDQATLDAGYSETAQRASTVVENLQFDYLVDLGNDQLAAVGPPDREDLLFLDLEKTRLLTLSPPANKPSTAPLPFGGHLIVPSSSGQVARVDPTNGRLVGAPFQPPVSPTATVTWLQPVPLGTDRFAVAVARSTDGPSMLYLVSAAKEQRLEELASLESPSAFKNQLATDGQAVFAVLQGDGQDQLVAYTGQAPLAQTQSVTLPGRCVAGPWLTDFGLILKLDTDELACYSTELKQVWLVEDGNEQLACPPVLVGSQLVLCYQNGVIALFEPGAGQRMHSLDLGQPLIHRPLFEGEQVMISGLDGTVHVIDLGQLSK